MLVVMNRMVSQEYFMDKMEQWEMLELYNNLKYTDMQSWEQTRLIAYMVASPYMKNRPDIKKFMSFSWDVDFINKKDVEISNNDIARLQSLADSIGNSL